MGRSRGDTIISSVVVLAVLSFVVWRWQSGHRPLHLKSAAANARSADKYVVPSPSAVDRRSGYDIRPCPTSPPPAGASLLTAQAISQRPGAGNYLSTSLVDVGTLDVQDGRLWQGGGEYLPAPDNRSTKVPPGSPRVTLLVANTVDQKSHAWSDVAAVEVLVGDATPVRWAQVDTLGGGSDAATMAIGGMAAVQRLSHVRSFDDAQHDLKGHNWLTHCDRIFMDTHASPPPITALEVYLNGDGGWPGAIGYDAADKPVDVVLSSTILPWSLFGLPGTPPSEAVASEPSPR